MSAVSPVFDDLDMSLHQAGVEAGPAELHGLICAALCMHSTRRMDDWFDEEVFVGDEPSAARHACWHLLANLWLATSRELQAEDFELRLLLPEDDVPLAERTEALADWCSGFIYAFGVSGEDVMQQLSADGREFLDDLTALTRVDADGAEESNEDDADFEEIVQYLRVGVMMIYQDFAPDDNQQQGAVH